ncbi:MAG: YidC/Oxa1 family membrane protein insertase [Eubacterium sp.]|nr:YidC/Oxa1 family membrane protein insertase [Eubacterium sp.]
MSMWSLLAQPFGYLLSFFYNITGHYWAAIIILSVIIRVAMYPLFKKQILSTAGMANMQGKVKDIQQKYANDRETMNEKMQELYQEEGFNPTAGCLPMIIQMIVISGLFILLRYPLRYISDESMVFAVHESFLWIKDMSQPDLWILPILSGIATFLSFSMQNSMNAGAQAGGLSTNMMKYVFPLMIVWLARSYPAGLAVYWFISQFTQIFFNLRFNKLRKEIQENGAKTKKKKKTAAA